MLIITKIINIIKKSNILSITRIMVIIKISAITIILAILVYHYVQKFNDQQVG